MADDFSPLSHNEDKKEVLPVANDSSSSSDSENEKEVLIHTKSPQNRTASNSLNESKEPSQIQQPATSEAVEISKNDSNFNILNQKIMIDPGSPDPSRGYR